MKRNSKISKRLADEALRLSEERMFKAQRMAHVGNWEWDVVNNTLYWSDEVYRIYGRDPETFVPTFEAVGQAMHPADLEPFIKAVNAAIYERKHFEMDYRLIRPDGTERTVHTIGTVDYDQSGRPLMKSGTVQDITEQKRAEESLLLFKKLLDRSSDAIFVNDPATGRFLIVNEKACASLGYSRDELLALRTIDIEEIFPDQAAWDAHVGEVRKKGCMILEGTHRRGDGTSYPVEVNVAYMTLGETDYMVAVARDITERKQAEDALAESEQFLESVFASIQDEITILDLDHKIVRYNPTIGRRYSKSLPLIGKKCYEAFLGRPDVCEGCPSALSMATGKTARAEMPATGPSGGVCAWVDIHAFPLVDANTGKMKGVIEYVRDITDRKLLERRNADFYAMLTHDLNSPLSALMGYAEMLKDSRACGADEEALDIAGQITKCGQKLKKLINNYLEISKLEFGSFNINPTMQDVAETVSEAVEDVRLSLKNKGIELESVIPDGLPRISIDRKYILRAVSNLLQNAVKFTARGGRVLLKAGCRTEKGRRFLSIEISDTGCGVLKEDMGRIFEKYYRSPKAAGSSGTGLGLYIVKTVAEAHGGRVEVESEEGKGSAFRLILPA